MDETGGGAIDVRDPLAARLKALSDAAKTPAEAVTNLLSVEQVFPVALASNAVFVDALTQAYEAWSRMAPARWWPKRPADPLTRAGSMFHVRAA